MTKPKHPDQLKKRGPRPKEADLRVVNDAFWRLWIHTPAGKKKLSKRRALGMSMYGESVKGIDLTDNSRMRKVTYQMDKALEQADDPAVDVPSFYSITSKDHEIPAAAEKSATDFGKRLAAKVLKRSKA